MGSDGWSKKNSPGERKERFDSRTVCSAWSTQLSDSRTDASSALCLVRVTWAGRRSTSTGENQMRARSAWGAIASSLRFVRRSGRASSSGSMSRTSRRTSSTCSGANIPVGDKGYVRCTISSRPSCVRRPQALRTRHSNPLWVPLHSAFDRREERLDSRVVEPERTADPKAPQLVPFAELVDQGRTNAEARSDVADGEQSFMGARIRGQVAHHRRTKRRLTISVWYHRIRIRRVCAASAFHGLRTRP